jgi:hypothetical protein
MSMEVRSFVPTPNFSQPNDANQRSNQPKNCA